MEANDISSMLGVLLQNKELMDSVKEAVASGKKTGEKVTDGNAEIVTESAVEGLRPNEAEMADAVEVSDRSGPTAVDRRCLIEALEPFLSPERRETARKLLIAVELLSADKLFKGR